MGILSMVEDRPTPKEVYNWRIYFLATVASFASCMIGYDSAFIGGTIALDSFRDEFGFQDMSPDEVGLISANIVSLYQAGAFFGSLFAYPIGFYWGRKIGLLSAGTVFILGAGLMLGSNGSRGLALMYAGRVLAGVGVGAGSNMTPIYISELSPPAIRGRLVGVYELGWQLGGLVGFWINVSRESSSLRCLGIDIANFSIHIVRRGFYHGSKPYAVDNPHCRSADSLWYVAYRRSVHSRVAALALLKEPQGRSDPQPQLDPPTFPRRGVYGGGDLCYR